MGHTTGTAEGDLRQKYRKSAGWAWADRGADTNSNAVFVITKTGEDTGVIRRNDSVKCLAVSTEDGTKVARAENEEEAAEFRFAKVKGIINTDITIEHKKTGKFIKTAPTAADGITKVTLGEKDDEGTVFSNAVFGESSTSTASGESYKTVSFISQNYGNGIASARWVDGAYADYLFMSNTITGNGWETVRVIPNGDGTVSLKDAYFDQFVTVDDEGALKCGYEGELTDNEKFILHTETLNRANQADLTVKKDIYEIQLGMDDGCRRVQAAADLAETLKEVSTKLAADPNPYTTEGYKMVKSSFDSADAAAVEAARAADLVKADEDLLQAETLAELLGQLKAGTLDESGFTEEGAFVYRLALENLKKVLARTSYTQEQLTLAVERVHAAEELAAELKKAADCEESNYTEESYQSYQESVEKAKVAAKVSNATAEQLVKVTEPLKTTLVLKARKTLSDALETIAAKGLKAADYTNKSWHDYKNIIRLAQNVADDVNATAEECNNALQTLKEVPRVLVLKSGSEKEQAFAALQSALIQAKNAGYAEDDYTAESWKTYQKVLDDASALTELSSLDEIKTAIQEVKKASGRLVKKGQNSGTNDPDHTTIPGGNDSGNNIAKPDGNDSGNGTTKPDSGKDNSGNTDTKNGAQNLIVHTKKVYMVKGQSRKLKVKLTPENSSDTVSYESSRPSVVTVKNGKLKAKKTGSAVIIVKTGSGKTATVKVTVVKKAVKAKAVRLKKKATCTITVK